MRSDPEAASAGDLLLARPSADDSSSRKRPRRGLRILLAGFFLLLSWPAILRYLRDERLRNRAVDFADKIELRARRPEEAEAMGYEPAGDLAAALVVRTALDDSQRSFRLKGLSPRLRKSWESFQAQKIQTVDSAKVLMLDALRARPGWFHPHLLLAQIARASTNGRPAPDPVGRSSRKTLRAAAAAAPGVDSVWLALAQASLEDWPALEEPERHRVPGLLRRAFLDETFARREFPRAVSLLGMADSIALLPDSRPRPIFAALESIARQGDIGAAAQLLRRIESAEWRRRVADLASIEQQVAAGDSDDAWSMCITWTLDHRIGEYDGRAGRRQIARLLEIWPTLRAGSWERDRRREIISFFLNGRLADAPAAAMARAVMTLTNVPPSIQARVRLAAGDAEGAAELAAAAAEDASFEWIAYFVDLSRHELAAGRPASAREALEAILPRAGDECDVLLSRRTVARALGDTAEALELGRRISGLSERAHPAEAWTASGTLPLCLDPENPRLRRLRVAIQTAEPAVIAYGWDGGRQATLVLKSDGEITIPTAGLQGRRMFSITSIFGGPARPGTTVLESSR